MANRLASLSDYLEGAVDLHVHSSPDVDLRRYDDVALAREAARALSEPISCPELYHGFQYAVASY